MNENDAKALVFDKWMKELPGKQWQCVYDECGKVFDDKHSRNKCICKKHILSEHLDVQYKCFHCEHIAIDPTARLKHIRAVHVDTLHPCAAPTCDKVFTRADNRNTHVKTCKHMQSEYK